MKIITEYLKDSHFFRGVELEEWETIPSKEVGFTGKYKTVNGEMFVEIGEERNIPRSAIGFLLRKKPRTYIHTRWIPEYCFRFYEIEYFECGEAE